MKSVGGALEWGRGAGKRIQIGAPALEQAMEAYLARPKLRFTGLRKSEALTMEWRHVHEDRIHLPVTKNGRSFDLPVLQLHHEILAPVRGLHRQWVFASPKGPDGRLTSPQRIEWSPHAHRRTFATVAMEAGVLEEIVGRLLNHTPLSITGRRYTKPSIEALRPSMELACAELERRSFAGTKAGRPSFDG